MEENDPVLRKLALEAAREKPEIELPAPDDGLSSGSLSRCLGCLRPASLFQGLKIHELARIADQTQWTTLDPGAVLLRQGAPGERVYVVCSGRLVSVGDGQGRMWLSGDVVGDIACLDGGPQLATVRCEAKAMLLSVSCKAFEQIVLQCPVVGLNLGSIYSAWLKDSHQRLTRLSDRPILTGV